MQEDHTGAQEMNEERSRERVSELRGYYNHVASFVAVNLFLFVVNMMDYQNAGDIWFVYPMFGWGIGLIIHTYKVFMAGTDWEYRKLQELTGRHHTGEELERLVERIDNLVRILSSVDWEKIDPELVTTKDRLEQARQGVTGLQDGDEAENLERLTREIEKLEEFVTSSKFNYYDLAQSDK